VVKESHSIWWWLLTFLLLALSIGRIVAGDAFGALAMGMIACVSWFMVRDSCSQMTQTCVMMFGMMCTIQTVFEVINLATNAGGRKTTIVSPPQYEGNKMSYTTTVVTHAFFDEAQGWHYNFQSAMMVAAPIVMLIGALLAWTTYSYFPTSLFADEGGPESGPMMGGYGGPVGASAYGSGGGGQYSGPGRTLGSTSANQQRPVFGGSGQRLGSNN
jgi:hypothetical protein